MSQNKLTQQELERRNTLKAGKPLVYAKIRKFSAKYRRGESIAIIQFQYDYRCNFRCRHCSVKQFQGKKNAQALTIPDVRKLFAQADAMGLARVTITGGEPLVFKDLDQLVKAIDPRKFYINCDTNGWLLDEKKARHLKSIGVDRIQLSLDNLYPARHDSFRRAPGSFARAMRAIEAAKKAGLAIFIQTVATKQRLHSAEFIKFIEYFNQQDISVFVTFAKPVGAWENNFSGLIDKKDLVYMRALEKKYRVFTHLTPAYGLDMGCIAVKGMFSITRYGDVLPCPYIHVSLGNVFNEPLKNIIKRGLGIKFFGEHVDTCLIAQDRGFIKKYIAGRVYGRDLPVASGQVFTGEDKTRKPFWKKQ